MANLKIRQLQVITSYPEKGALHGQKTGGVASYTKALLTELVHQFPELEVTVYADRFEKKSTYEEEKVIVKRRWVRERPASVWQVFQDVSKQPSQHVFISFEAYMFGTLPTASLLILGMILLRLKGKRVTLLLHQVLDNFHLIETNKVKASLLNLAKDTFYWIVRLLSTQVIVFEEELKRRMGNKNKIYVLPHLVPEVKTVSKKEAAEKLGLPANQKYILYFGFLSLYKGVDWLLENWPQNSEYKLIIGGGMSNTQKKHAQAVALNQKIERLSEETLIPVTGFIPEKSVKYYFALADAVILPYKIFMSSSGPLSLAFAHHKPVLISEVLRPYAESQDFKLALKDSQLTIQDLVFQTSKQSLIANLKNIGRKEKELHTFAEKMRFYRSRQIISRVLFAILSREEQLDLRPMLLGQYLGQDKGIPKVHYDA